MQRTAIAVWSYRQGVDAGISAEAVVGYHVEAIDGSIGKVDEAMNDAGASYLVVDTGPWIFGKKVMLPAGVIRDVDHDEKRIFVNRAKEQIENAPEFDDSMTHDEVYRDRVGSYYGDGPGYRDWDDR